MNSITSDNGRFNSIYRLFKIWTSNHFIFRDSKILIIVTSPTELWLQDIIIKDHLFKNLLKIWLYLKSFNIYFKACCILINYSKDHAHYQLFLEVVDYVWMVFGLVKTKQKRSIRSQNQLPTRLIPIWMYLESALMSQNEKLTCYMS